MSLDYVGLFLGSVLSNNSIALVCADSEDEATEIAKGSLERRLMPQCISLEDIDEACAIHQSSRVEILASIIAFMVNQYGIGRDRVQTFWGEDPNELYELAYQVARELQRNANVQTTIEMPTCVGSDFESRAILLLSMGFGPRIVVEHVECHEGSAEED